MRRTLNVRQPVDLACVHRALAQKVPDVRIGEKHRSLWAFCIKDYVCNEKLSSVWFSDGTVTGGVGLRPMDDGATQVILGSEAMERPHPELQPMVEQKFPILYDALSVCVPDLPSLDKFGHLEACNHKGECTIER
jgi:hypothetical protein